MCSLNAPQLEVLNRIPSVADMLAGPRNSAELKDFLDKFDPLCFPLLRWIITSNRTHLELLPKDVVRATSCLSRLILR